MFLQPVENLRWFAGLRRGKCGRGLGMRSFGRGFSPIVLLLTLSACGTSAQREGARMQQQEAATNAVSSSCFQELRAKPEYAELLTRLYMSEDSLNFPLTYLTNPSRPAKKDLVDLFAFHAGLQACRKLLLDGQSKIHPLIVSTQVEGFTASDKLWAEFASGKIAWGEFNTRRKDVAVETQRQMLAASQAIGSQLTDSHRYEVAQRQRAAEALSRWAAQQQAIQVQQQAINAMNRSRTTNCTGSGNTISCQTD
jgi:hypothetical protein